MLLTKLLKKKWAIALGCIGLLTSGLELKAQAPTVLNDTLCGGGSATLRAFGSTDPLGQNYVWYASPTGGTPLPNTSGVFTLLAPRTTTLYVALVDGGVESARVPVTAVVRPKPVGLNARRDAGQWAHLPILNGVRDVTTNAIPVALSGQGNANDRFNAGAGAASFTGGTAGLVMNSLRRQDSTTVFTWSAWVQTNDANGGPIFSFGTSANAVVASAKNDRVLYVAPNGTLRYRQGGDSAMTVQVINNNTWTHVAVSRASNGTVNLYVNGYKTFSDSLAAPDTLNGYIRMVFDAVSGGLTNRLGCNLDEVRLYDRALTDSEVESIFQTPSVGILLSGLAACGSTNTNVRLTSTQTGVRYSLIDANTSTQYGNAVLGGGAISLTHTFTNSAVARVVAVDTTTGCFTILDTNVRVTVNAVPAPPTPASPDYSSCGANSFTLVMRGGTQGNYRWYTAPTGGVALILDSSFVVNLNQGDSIVYFVSVVGVNGCESARTRLVARAYVLPLPKVGSGIVDNTSLFAQMLFDANYSETSSNRRSVQITNGLSLSFVTDRKGVASQAIRFTGQNGVVAVNSAIPSPGPNNVTVAVWFRTTATAGGKLVGFQGSANGATGSYDRQIYIANNGILYWGVNSGGTRTIASTRAYNDGQWHLAVGQVGPAGMKFWINGALQGEIPTVTTGQGFGGFWIMGGGSTSGWTNAPGNAGYNGDLDDVHIFNRMLSDAEILELAKVNGVGLRQQNTQICGAPSAGTLTLANTQAGFIYQLRNSASGTLVGGPVLSSGANLTLLTDVQDTTTSYRVLVRGVNNTCSTELDTTITFFGGSLPAAPFTLNQQNCGRGAVTLLASAGTGAQYRWFADSTSTQVLGTDSIYTTAAIDAGDSVTFWVATLSANGCLSERKAVKGVVVPQPVNINNNQLSNLRHRFTFANGSNNDSRGNLVGTANVGVSNTASRTGVADDAKRFDGTVDARITTTPQITAVGTGLASYSMSLWFRTTSTTGGRLLGFTGSGNTNTTQDRLLYINSRNQVAFMTRAATGQNPDRNTISSTKTVNDGNWHHVVATFSANGMQLYLDGNLAATNPNARTQQTGNGFWRVGADLLNNVNVLRPTTDFYTGDLDDVFIYNRVLGDEDVLALYNVPTLTLAASASSLCGPGPLKIRLRNARAGVRYLLNQDNTPFGSPVPAVGDSVVWDIPNLVNTSNFTINASSDVTGCTIRLDTLLNIRVNTIPTVAGVNDTTRCGSGAVTLRASGAANGRYRWYADPTGGVALGNNATLSSTITLGTGITADSVVRYVSVISLEGCESPRLRVRARAFANPTATTTLAAAATGACIGDSVQLTATGTYNRYIWRLGATSVDTTTGTFFAKAQGAYTVLGLSDQGCTGPASAATTVNFTAKPATPVINFQASPNPVVSITPVTGATYIWIFNGSVLTGATTASITSNVQSGTYQVIVNLRGCRSDTSAPFNVVSLTNRIAGGTAKVYPNPASQFCALEATGINAATATVQVVDLTGRVLLAQTAAVDNGVLNTNLNLADLSSGQYTVLISAEGKTLVTKLNVTR